MRHDAPLCCVLGLTMGFTLGVLAAILSLAL